MDKNKEVITGLIKIKDWANFALNNHWMMTDGIEKMKEYADNAISLLLTLDVTPEELERLKKCRHECKIDCLLEHYEKIKAERDALLEAQEPNEDWISRKRLKDEIQYYIDEAGWGDEANKVLGWCMEFIDNQRAVKWG